MLLLVLSPFSKETSMKQVNSFGYTVLLLLLLGGCTPGVKQVEKPRNIILMIGDGMGTNHIYAGMVANGMDLNLAACNYVGFQKTYSFNSDITDSGASATAMATGKKTRNGVISVGPDGKPLKTIVELAEERGLSTGLIATSTITHATPAAFAAHDTSRGNYEQIAEDLCRSGVDVIIGGGRYHFMRREDGLNLLDTLMAKGYFIGERIEDIPGSYGGPVAIFTDTMAMPSALEGRGDVLAASSAIAVNRLSKNPEGFFMMIEGSQIDWAAHANNTEGLVSEVLDFDRAIGKVLDFARKDGHTLVIVTADHETGGFTLLKGGPSDPVPEGAFSSDGHTGVMVPVFAFGPGAKEFSGIYENTGIFDRMRKLLEL
jgi:alkaline phosphatase